MSEKLAQLKKKGGGTEDSYMLITSLSLTQDNASAYANQNKFYGVKKITIDGRYSYNTNGTIALYNIDNGNIIKAFASGTFSNEEIDCTNTPNVYFGQSSTQTHQTNFTNIRIYYK